jgi:hypothetical protein
MAKTYIIRNQGKGTLTNIDPVDLIDISGEGGAGGGGSSSPITIQNTNSLFSTGVGAGTDSFAQFSNFFGQLAGYQATYASQSNFIGFEAGYGATGTEGEQFNSNFFGQSAGSFSTNAEYSNFFGYFAGYQATYANYSNFLGYQAGYQATNAANSIFIGTNAGNNDTVDNTINFLSSILIGSYTNTGGFSNSILLGSGADGNPIANTKANQFMLADTITDVRWSGIEYTLPSVQAANAGDVLSNDGDGVLSWVVAGGAGQNFANTNLTFDANRTHDLNGFNLQISGNQGANTIYLDLMQNRFYTYTISDEGGQSYFIVESGSDGSGGELNRIDLIVYSNLGSKSSRINLQDGCIDISPTDGLKINGNVGTSGQVLTSQGNNATPVWADGGSSARFGFPGEDESNTTIRVYNSTDGASFAENYSDSVQPDALYLYKSYNEFSATISSEGNKSLRILSDKVELSVDSIAGDLSQISTNQNGTISFNSNRELLINSSAGTLGQVLTSQGVDTPPIWADVSGGGAVPTLQQVVAAGNITTQDIAISAAALQFNNPGGDKYIYGNQLVGIPSPVTIFQLPDVGGIIPVSVNGQTADANGNITLPSEIVPNLQEVTDSGNTTSTNIILAGAQLRFQDNDDFKILNGNNLGGAVGDTSFLLPDVGGVLVTSVNGNFADSNGNIELSGSSLQNLMNLIPQTASYILLDTDFDITQDNSIEMDVATANTLNINATLLASVPIGSKLNVIQYGVGQTQITVTAGAVLLSAGGADKIANRYGAATIVKRSATEFYLFGDIVA